MNKQRNNLKEYYKSLVNNAHKRFSIAEHEYLNSIEANFNYMFNNSKINVLLNKICKDNYLSMAKAFIYMKKMEHKLSMVLINEGKIEKCEKHL